MEANALKPEHTEWKNELKKIIFFVVIFFAALKAYYWKESLFVVIKLWFAHLYMFILPGYALMLCYRKKIEFIYRLFIGTGLGFALQGLLTYLPSYIFNINILSIYKFTPLIIYAAAGLLLWRKK